MVWLSENDERPQVARQSSRSRKRMIIIFICNDDPELIEVLPEGDHINATHYRDNTCMSLINILKQKDR